MDDPVKALDEAIAIAGSQSELSRKSGWSQQLISYYRTNRKAIPGEMAVAFENATGIPRSRFRPDLFSPLPA